MGININAQTKEGIEYVEALQRWQLHYSFYKNKILLMCGIKFNSIKIHFCHSITTQVNARMFRPWLHKDWIYYRSSRGKEYKNSVEIAHRFTDKVKHN